MWHKWKNLKNSWDNKERLDAMFDRTYIDEAIASIIAVIVFLIALSVYMSLQGCTTLKHEPKCSCDCKINSSHFECGGKNHYEDIELQ